MDLMTQPAGPALDGNWFEDFFVGQRFRHATPRTITMGDASLHIALTGARQPLFCAAPLAARLGHPAPPIDDMLVFNMAFGKTVADISINAVANLGYADLRFCRPVYAGDTIRAESEVIGLRPTSAGDAGVVYVRSTAHNQHDLPVMSWIRWVLVRKRDLAAPDRAICIPTLADRVATADLALPPGLIDARAVVEATIRANGWRLFEQRVDPSRKLRRSRRRPAQRKQARGQAAAEIVHEPLVRRGGPDGQRHLPVCADDQHRPGRGLQAATPCDQRGRAFLLDGDQRRAVSHEQDRHPRGVASISGAAHGLLPARGGMLSARRC